MSPARAKGHCRIHPHELATVLQQSLEVANDVSIADLDMDERAGGIPADLLVPILQQTRERTYGSFIS